MREILFKAKGIDKDDCDRWYEGYYWFTKDYMFCFSEDYEKAAKEGRDPRHHYILFDGYSDWCMPVPKYKAEINPKTLCQYIGLKDKNGNKIWENDIVECIWNGKSNIYIVIWDEDEQDFKATNGDKNYSNNFAYLGSCDEIEVLGTIFDNPELLVGDK